MLGIDVTIDARKIGSLSRELAATPAQLEKAQLRALNRTVAKQRTASDREIRKKLALKSAQVKKDLRLEKATAGDLVASFGAVERRRPVWSHGPVYTGTRQTNKGLSVRDRKDRPRRLILGGFNARHKRVSMRREEKNGRLVPRLPVSVVYGESPAEVFGDLADKFEISAVDYYRRRLIHEIDWIIGRIR